MMVSHLHDITLMLMVMALVILMMRGKSFAQIQVLGMLLQIQTAMTVIPQFGQKKFFMGMLMEMGTPMEPQSFNA